MAHERTCDGDTLPLAAGQLESALELLAQRCLEAVRQMPCGRWSGTYEGAWRRLLAGELGLHVEQVEHRRGGQRDLMQVRHVPQNDEQAPAYLEDDSRVQRQVAQREPPVQRHRDDETVRQTQVEAADQ